MAVLAILGMATACTRPLKEVTYMHGIETGKVYADSLSQLGTLYVKDKTVLEAQNEMEARISEFIEGTSVQVKLVDRTITVLGEVQNPGVHNIFKNQLSIFEALGTADDIYDWGNRKNVKLLRQTDEGKEIIALALPTLRSSILNTIISSQ
ncbi:hypothetical protein KA005_49495 [bacterium]|nr:hypothetical protein [bacterium]